MLLQLIMMSIMLFLQLVSNLLLPVMYLYLCQILQKKGKYLSEVSVINKKLEIGMKHFFHMG